MENTALAADAELRRWCPHCGGLLARVDGLCPDCAADRFALGGHPDGFDGR
jgi:NMD protein affecting ribosome stability and mRNA decay